MFWERNAVTDGDSIVHFRIADVIVAGNIFTTTQFPFIDVRNGGSVEGEINALNDILARTVYKHQGEGGTLVVPGHGYLSDDTRWWNTGICWRSFAIVFASSSRMAPPLIR
jgi:glyoxylase-like metal-dependent hydrolase (beta-lactamase superfamily II)